MVLTREQVEARIAGERAYQDRRWGDLSANPHATYGWLKILDNCVGKAEVHIDARQADWALDDIRKATAVAAACLEQHRGKRPDIGNPDETDFSDLDQLAADMRDMLDAALRHSFNGRERTVLDCVVRVFELGSAGLLMFGCPPREEG
jgi:hypothetical protein